MTVWQTLLVFVVIPAAVYGLIALGTVGRKGKQNPRYRPGREWPYPAVWWTANPEGVGEHHTPDHHGAEQHGSHESGNAAPAGKTVLGGASGGW